MNKLRDRLAEMARELDGYESEDLPIEAKQLAVTVKRSLRALIADAPETPAREGLSTTVEAPWSDEIIKHLEARQNNLTLHPYTCHCGAHLRPERAGWRCDECHETVQTWAHSTDALLPASPPSAELREALDEARHVLQMLAGFVDAESDLREWLPHMQTEREQVVRDAIRHATEALARLPERSET